MSAVGEYLKKVRTERKQSLKAVTAKTGIRDSTLSKIESGKTESPSPIHLKRLAVEYQIDLIDLFLKAGYLERTNLSEYQMCFIGADSLSEEERAAVQNIIDIIIEKPGRCPR